LDEFAEDLASLFDLARCEVWVVAKDGTQAPGGHFGEDEALDASLTVELPMRTDREQFGVVRIVPQEEGSFGDEERKLAEAFVSQMALAMESVRLQEKTRSAEAEAEASRIRAALFSSVTHDLRTPLSSIKASATSLLEEGVSFDDSQREELLRTIAEESDRLNRLIGNLLDLSRLRAGALVPEKVFTPIEEVIEGVASRMRKLLSDHRLKVRVRTGIPPVPIDVLQIDQVLSNLLENAARFAPPESEIEVKATKWQSSVEIEVSDRGPGIPAEDRERVFQEFYRRDSEYRKGEAGLGLSIARAIVAAHGGSMWIHETPGGGATVGLRLPLESRTGDRD
jgi:two-component system sensor histidine kinase KdpD